MSFARAFDGRGSSPGPIDEPTVRGFGDEWQAFDQTALTEETLRRVWDSYFDAFPWQLLPTDAVGADIGCGSGRWARFVAERVGLLWCVDPSVGALDVAVRNLAAAPNVHFSRGAAGALPFRDNSLDFAYSLGVLHHTPEPAVGLADCVRILRPGAPLLVYLYYAFDNRPRWFRTAWQVSDLARRILSRAPFAVRRAVSAVVAAVLYLPLARLSALLARPLGSKVELIPLSIYRDKPFYVMRNDALDRFGTRLEHRFTSAEVREMMESAGLVDVRVSPGPPYWCATGVKASAAS